MHGGWGVQAHWAVTVIFATLCMNNVLCSVDMNFCLENNAMQCCVQCHMIYIFIYICMLPGKSHHLKSCTHTLTRYTIDCDANKIERRFYIYIIHICT